MLLAISLVYIPPETALSNVSLDSLKEAGLYRTESDCWLQMKLIAFVNGSVSQCTTMFTYSIDAGARTSGSSLPSLVGQWSFLSCSIIALTVIAPNSMLEWMKESL